MTAVTDHTDHTGHTDHSDPTDHSDHSDHMDRSGPTERTERTDRSSRPGRPGDADRSDDTDRASDTDPSDHGDGADPGDRSARPGLSGHTGRVVPTDHTERAGEVGHTDRADRADHTDRGDRTGRRGDAPVPHGGTSVDSSSGASRAEDLPAARTHEKTGDSETPPGAGRSSHPADPPRADRPPTHAPLRDDGGHARVTDDAGHARVKDDNTPTRTESRTEPESVWDDGLIARRASEAPPSTETPVPEARTAAQAPPPPLAYDGLLRSRLDALRELVGLSRARLDGRTLAEAGKVLDEAAARRKLSGQHTVVAIAGATGSGKSQLFNALAGVAISETGVRRPTTAAPIACSWSDGAATLIDRLGIPGRLRRRPLQSPEGEAQLHGLVLVDLPDHDSAAVQHREHVDRILALVDAVIWVVDPEKYADAMLHERYLRPMAGHAEVTFVVLNQVDRLPGEAADLVLDDLRRLLDEDGIALGEYGEPGATVLGLSALTGEGIGELREALGQFVAERGAAARRISADLDAAAARLRPVYAAGGRTGLSEEARDEFSDRLADAVGATAAGQAAERAWRRNANRACGTPWLRLWHWCQDRREPPTGRHALRVPADEEATARQRVEQAVRTVADRAARGLPAPWAMAVREAAVRGAQGLPEALDEMATRATTPAGRPPRPGWWPVAVLAQASMTLLQIVGGLWLLAQIVGVMGPNLWVPVLLMVAGIIGGPAVEWSSRLAARGPARRYGLDAERRLREAAAGCGRARVLDPVAAELLRYREVREQFGRVTGASVG